MKVAVMGCGYVGLSLAILLSTKVEVVACDINSKKVDMINQRKCPIKDKDMEEYFMMMARNMIPNLKIIH